MASTTYGTAFVFALTLSAIPCMTHPHSPWSLSPDEPWHENYSVYPLLTLGFIASLTAVVLAGQWVVAKLEWRNRMERLRLRLEGDARLRLQGIETRIEEWKRETYRGEGRERAIEKGQRLIEDLERERKMAEESRARALRALRELREAREARGGGESSGTMESGLVTWVEEPGER